LPLVKLLNNLSEVSHKEGGVFLTVLNAGIDKFRYITEGVNVINSSVQMLGKFGKDVFGSLRSVCRLNINSLLGLCGPRKNSRNTIAKSLQGLADGRVRISDFV
jgi:hypothetical protein